MLYRHRYNFSGGQQNVSTDEARASSSVLSIVNGTCRREGGIERRTGFRTTTASSSSIGIGQASFIVTATLTNFIFTVGTSTIGRSTVQTDGSVVNTNISVTGGDLTYSSFARVLSMLGISGGVTAKYLFIVGGGDVPVTYDLSTVTRQVLTAPGAATVALGAAGVLNGTYSYKVTFVNDFGETTAGTASANISPSSEKVDLSVIPTGGTTEPYAVRQRKIYRTEAGGATYKLLTTINDNTTTTYTDNTADGSLGTTPQTINRCSTIPRGNDAAIFQGRLFVANNWDTNSNGANFYPYRVWFSKVDDGLNFATTDQNGTYVGYFDIPTFDAITGMGLIGGRLIIFTVSSMFAWDGYRLVDVSHSIGTPYGATITAGDNYLYFLDSHGVYRYNGGTPVRISDQINTTIDAISDFLTTYGIYHDSAYYLVVGTLTDVVEGISLTNAILVYDEGTRRWATWDLNTASAPRTGISYAYSSGGVKQGKRLFISAGSLYQEASTVYTDGSAVGSGTRPIQFSVTTGPMFGADPHIMKRFSKLIAKLKNGVGTKVFFRTSREMDYEPIGAANGDTLERAIESDGYFMDVLVTNSERGVPVILEGLSYAVSQEPGEVAEY